MAEADATFIAAARTDIPALLAAYDTLRARLDAVVELELEVSGANRSLRARLAAAERDAARYAFLRDNLVSVEYYVPFLSNDDLRCSVKTFGKRSANMPTLDEAIDALATPTTTEDTPCL